MTDLSSGGPLPTVLWISAIWCAIGVCSGIVAHLMSPDFLARDSWLTRIRGFESEGRLYERHLAIRSWKDRLPEAGALFGKGFSKRRLTDRSTPQLLRFTAETRRAEYVHWMNAAAGPVFFVFLPMWAGAVITVFALTVHLPFVLIQRYNRARLLRTLARRGVPVHRPPLMSLPPTAPHSTGP